MRTYENGQAAPIGVYISVRHLDMRVITGDDETLAGKEGVAYRRSPLLLIALLGPVLGGLFVMAMPFIIFAAFAHALLGRVAGFRTYLAGEQVPWGVYVGLNRPVVRHVSGSGEVLTARPGIRFVRVPTWLLLLASPALGGLYVVLFPLILAFAMVSVLVHLVVAAIGHALEKHGHLAQARWQPAASYLDAAAVKQAGTGTATDAVTPIDDGLGELEAEVAARRDAERNRGGSV
jgi:hypothetical protein